MDEPNATYDSLMAEIMKGVTGVASKDAPYLMSKAQEHADGPYGKEIARALGRMVYELLSDEDKSKVSVAIDDDSEPYRRAFADAETARQRGDIEGALSVMLPMAERLLALDESGVCAEDSQSVYLDFTNQVELLLYAAATNCQKAIRQPTQPFSDFYFVTASLYYDLGNFDEALAWLERARKWSPANPSVYFELAENYKRKGDIQSAEAVAMAAEPFITTKHQYARYYRLRGFCSMERGEYRLAAACLFGSLGFEESDSAFDEIMYMKQVLGADYTKMKPGEAVEVLRESDGSFGASEEKTGVIFGQLKRAMGEEQRDEASYWASAIYELTNVEEFRELAESLTAE